MKNYNLVICMFIVCSAISYVCYADETITPAPSATTVMPVDSESKVRVLGGSKSIKLEEEKHEIEATTPGSTVIPAKRPLTAAPVGATAKGAEKVNVTPITITGRLHEAAYNDQPGVNTIPYINLKMKLVEINEKLDAFNQASGDLRQKNNQCLGRREITLAGQEAAGCLATDSLEQCAIKWLSACSSRESRRQKWLQEDLNNDLTELQRYLSSESVFSE